MDAGNRAQGARGAGAGADEFAQTGVQIDPEFLDIFLDEAREEQGRIDETLGRWIADPADREMLAILRRSFHTLKGSGRLVGATRLADVAAITERLLDQVLIGALVASGPVIEQVGATARALPGLIEAEAGAQPIDLSALLRGAADLIAAPMAEPVSAREPITEAPSRETLPAQEPAEADSELLNIFVAEARGHLATLKEFLASAGPDAELRPEPGMLRALHTLCGSSRMAGIESIAGVSGALDRLFVELDKRGLAADPAISELLGRACEGLAERIDHLPYPGPEMSSLAEVALEAGEWTERLSGSMPAPWSHPERGLDVLPESELIELSDLAHEIAEAPSMAAEPPAQAEIESVAIEGPVEPESGAIAFEAAAEPEPESLVSEVLEEVEAAPAAFEAAVEAEPESVAFEAPAEAQVEPEAAAAPEPVEPEAQPVPVRVAAMAPGAPPGGERAGPQAVGGVQAELAALFLEDAREILDHLDDGLRRWQRAPQERAPLDAIQRRLHTLKGSARLSGLAPIGDLSHALEATLTAITRGELAVTDDTLDIAQRSLDALSDQVDAVEQGAPVPVAAELIAALAAPLEAGPVSAGEAAVAAPCARAGRGRTRGRGRSFDRRCAGQGAGATGSADPGARGSVEPPRQQRGGDQYLPRSARPAEQRAGFQPCGA